MLNIDSDIRALNGHNREGSGTISTRDVCHITPWTPGYYLH